jgi:hypothetical protein
MRASFIVFVVGVLLSGALSLVFIAAAGSLGFQPAPVGVHLLTVTLILFPWVALIARSCVRDQVRFEYITGTTMILVTVVYCTVMLALNP